MAESRLPEIQSNRSLDSTGPTNISGTPGPDAALNSFYRSAAVSTARKGQTIISPGQTCARVYLVASGRVERIGFGAGGHEIVVDTYLPGQLFGLEGLSWPRSRFPAIAAERSVLKVMAKASFEELIRREPDVALAVARMMATRLVQCHLLMYEFAHCSLQDRIMAALARLGRDSGTEHELGILIGRIVRERELARLVGASRPRVSLAIGQLIRDQRLAKVNGRFVVVKTSSDAGLQESTITLSPSTTQKFTSPNRFGVSACRSWTDAVVVRNGRMSQ